MRAAVFHGRHDVRVEEVPEPEPREGQVKLKVAANGICGSDLHLYYGSGPVDEADIPIEPFVLGHEFSGEVAGLGPGVSDLRVGDQVTVEPILRCDACPACEAGAYNVCEQVSFYGLGPGHSGGMAEYAVVERRNVHRLPDGVSLRDGALAEPLAVAYHAVQRGEVRPGQTAAVLGAGPIGVGVYLTLRAFGVERVLVSEPSPTRRAAVQALGADAVIDPTDDDVIAALHDLTGGRGVDVVFEVAGVPQTFTVALAASARQGRIVVVGVHELPVDFSPMQVVWTEQTLTGSMAYARDFEPVLRLMAEGRYPSQRWTEVIPLDDVVERGFVALHHQRAGKILVDPSAVPAIVRT